MSLADLVKVTPEMDAWLRETRRMIHVNPELMFEENDTADLVQKQLTEAGVEFKPNVGGDGRSLYMKAEDLARAGIEPGPPTGGTGVLATITGTKGAGPGKTVLLRADMDALPLDEENDVDYKSQNPGKMHACGHDLHTTVLMGVAEVLEQNKDRFDGTVKLMFQPGEEGGGGALAMIEDGILEDPKVDAAYALHVGVDHPAGHVSMCHGPRSAAADMFEIHVHGTGGHGAYPQAAVDTVYVASQIVVALQEIVSREVAAMDQAVLSVTTIHSGTAMNIIPERAVLSGTVRTYDENVRSHVEKRLAEVASGIAATFRAEADTVYLRGYPAMYNDEEIVNIAREACREVLAQTTSTTRSRSWPGKTWPTFPSAYRPACTRSVSKTRSAASSIRRTIRSSTQTKTRLPSASRRCQRSRCDSSAPTS
ncbi:MAG: M20 family metallopeptidase [Thermomicrobiales bacterium]